MHIKSTGGSNKHDKHIVHGVEKKGEGYARSDLASEDASQMVTSEQGLMCVWRNQTRSSPRRASNITKPRTRKASTKDKALEQVNIDMQNG